MIFLNAFSHLIFDENFIRKTKFSLKIVCFLSEQLVNSLVTHKVFIIFVHFFQGGSLRERFRKTAK